VVDLKIGYSTRREKAPAADGGRYNGSGKVPHSAWLETQEETPLYAGRGGS